MQQQESPPLRIRARGALACFTRPELKVERVSYPVMTPSAARGLIEAVLWKPAITWRIESIAVLSEIRFTSFLRNEVNTRASSPASAVVAGGGPAPIYFADEDRAQRNTVALRDVDYVIQARFHLTERAGPDETIVKFMEMFARRVKKGQAYHQPYFGCREFPADIVQADGAPTPIPDSREIGLMLWDIDFAPSGNRPVFFEAHLENGILNVPDDPGRGGTQ
jgi:CRISPR-associated protein Cas5d